MGRITKKNAGKICEWFSEVVEAHRAMKGLKYVGDKYNPLVEICLGNITGVIQIDSPESFERLVNALTMVYDKEFVGEVTDRLSHGAYSDYTWRFFKYAEFEVGTIVRDFEKAGENN